MEQKIDILNFDRAELLSELSTRIGAEKFRSSQIFQWLYRERVTDFSLMTNVSKTSRDQLSEIYQIYRPKIYTVQLSRDGTRKYLLEMKDGSKVETVLIRQPKRYTLCVSSQVGCAIGCKFCRTGLMGLKRHLETAEIIGQVLTVLDDVHRMQQDPSTPAMPEFFSNIVFMGMGEPLHNFDNVTRAVRILNDDLGINISQRKITVSTSGIVPSIEKFFEQKTPASLAISLNATTDESRTSLIPINKKWPLDMLLGALRNADLGPNKRITMEYVMLAGVNDTEQDLRRLPRILHGIPSKINLIPYNNNSGLGFFAPEEKWVYYWQDQLLQMGMNATVRWSKGMDISAACGQLATESSKKDMSEVIQEMTMASFASADERALPPENIN
jgi:23S rRNA (adenine2503-C2)-methyltransferase